MDGSPIGDPLGEFELLVLLTVRGLADEAFGGAVQLWLAIHAGRQVALGTIAKTLRRLEGKGLARSWFGSTRREPGGRRRVHYSVTPAGSHAAQLSLRGIARLVRVARRARPRLWVFAQGAAVARVARFTSQIFASDCRAP